MKAIYKFEMNLKYSTYSYLIDIHVPKYYKKE